VFATGEALLKSRDIVLVSTNAVEYRLDRPGVAYVLLHPSSCYLGRLTSGPKVTCISPTVRGMMDDVRDHQGYDGGRDRV